MQNHDEKMLRHKRDFDAARKALAINKARARRVQGTLAMARVAAASGIPPIGEIW